MNGVRAGLVGALLLGPGVASAAPAQEALRQFVDGVRTFSAGFAQEQRDEHGDVLQKSRGRVWLSRTRAGEAGTGRFHWAYEEPYRQLLVCDGESVWMYDPDLSQATVRPARVALAGTPAELLSRRGALEEQFNVSDGGLDAGARIVQLEPKSAEGDFRSIRLWLRGGTPVRMQFRDPLGGATDIVFSDVAVNRPVEDARFAFTPPPGVDVVSAD